jgi:hypothetical protein
MALEVRKIDVLIASPGDAVQGRDVIEKALHDWNGHRGDAEGIILRPRRWETDAVPIIGEGDAQSVINSQLVDTSEIVFAVFYHRLGSPTDRAVSGTAEEIARSVANGKRVHLYFAEKDIPYDADLEQFSALRKFREQMGKQGLVASFKTRSELKTAVSRAIDLDITEINGGAKGVMTSIKASSKGRRLLSPDQTNLEVKFRPGEYRPGYYYTPRFGEAPDQLLIKNIDDSKVSNVSVRAMLPRIATFTFLTGPHSIGSGLECAYTLTRGARFLESNEERPTVVIIAWKKGDQSYESSFTIALNGAIS